MLIAYLQDKNVQSCKLKVKATKALPHLSVKQGQAV